MANIFQRIGSIFRRSTVSQIGPAKDWTLWRSISDAWGISGASATKTNILQIPAFWRAVELISTQVASLPFSVFTQQPDGTVNEAYTNPVWRLLNYRPSEKYDGFSFMEAIIRIMFTGTTGYPPGNCLIGIMWDSRGAAQSLHIIHDSFSIVETQGGGVAYVINGQAILSADIIHLKAWTRDGITGGDLLMYQKPTLDRAISEIHSFRDFYKRGANVSGILETDAPLNPTQRSEMMKGWESEYGGQANQGKTALLSHGVKYKTIGRALAESDLAARRLTVEDVANITGVPLPLLSASQGVPMNNLEVLNRLFVQYTLRAWCKRIESEFNTKLFQYQPGNAPHTFARFNMDGLLRGDTASRAAYYREMYNIRAMNPNEIRALEGMNPYDGGELYGQPLASNSQEQVNQEQTQQEDEQGNDN